MIAIIMIVYQWALIFCDFLHLLVMSTWMLLVSMYHVIFPVEKKNLAGQIALVTGSGHGIGKELALQLSRMGVKVVCCDINEEWNKNTVQEIKAEDGVAWGYKLDVSSKDEVKTVMDKVKREVGDIHLLFNNAGIMPCKAFLKHSPELVEKIFGINVFAHFWTVGEWLPTFMDRGSGHIVALSSIAGLMGTNNLVPYCSSKFAVRGLMEGLKEELRYDNKFTNIKLTCVHPFIIDTGLAHKPRIRFPSFNPITPPSKAAEVIIDGVQRDYFHVSIPSKDFYFFKLASFMPLAIQHIFADFLDAEVDEHDN